MENQENIELIRRHFRNEEIGDSPAVLEEMTDDCFYYIYAISNERLEGIEQISGVHNSLISGFTDLYIKIESIFATDEYGCAQVILGGKHTGEWDGLSATGKDVYFHTATVFKFRDGKIVSESVYFDRRELLRQLGIEESLTVRN